MHEVGLTAFMSIGRSALALGVTSCLSIALLVLSPVVVYAKCQPYSNDRTRVDDHLMYKDGWYASTYSPTGGVYSDILNYSPWVQPNSEVVAWSMLTDGPTWAQVGWWESAGGSRQTFGQWSECEGCRPITEFHTPAAQVNTYTEYKVLWNNACSHCISLYAAGTRLWVDTITWTPTIGEVFGEILTLASQMPGAGSYYEDFSNSHVFQGGWRAFSGQVGDDNTSYFGYQYNGTLDFKIWDSDCYGT